jgi:hypothetical protein
MNDVAASGGFFDVLVINAVSDFSRERKNEK